MKDDESSLIKKSKNGDSISFGELVKLYEKQVYNMALRFAGNTEDACDIAQDTFLRAFSYIKSFKEESAFSTWLYRITINCCNDYVKKRKKTASVPLYQNTEDGDEEEIQISDNTYNPEDIYEKEQLKELVKTAISSLPEDYKQAIILRDINGLSYDEIAYVLKIEIGTVKSRISRGREKLKAFILKSGNLIYDNKSNNMKEGSDT